MSVATPSRTWVLLALTATLRVQNAARDMGCSIDRVPALSPADFRDNYRGIKPVIFTLTAPVSSAQWRPEALCKEHGHRLVKLGQNRTLALHGDAVEMQVPLSQYLGPAACSSVSEKSGDGMADDFKRSARYNGYHFQLGLAPGDPMDLPGAAEAVANYSALEPYFDGVEWSPVVSLDGGAQQKGGIPFHRHYESWLFLIHGRKQWAVARPDGEDTRALMSTFDDNISAHEWFDTIGTKLPNGVRNPDQCVQEQGEIIYLPTGWWHAVANLNDAKFLNQSCAEHETTNAELAVAIGGQKADWFWQWQAAAQRSPSVVRRRPRPEDKQVQVAGKLVPEPIADGISTVLDIASTQGSTVALIKVEQLLSLEFESFHELIDLKLKLLLAVAHEGKFAYEDPRRHPRKTQFVRLAAREAYRQYEILVPKAENVDKILAVAKRLIKAGLATDSELNIAS